jgi:hypothetical protein
VITPIQIHCHKHRHIYTLINKCRHSYVDSNVRREGSRIRKKLDIKIKHNEALAKRVIDLMRKEQEDRAERTEKEDVSCLKKEATKDMVSRWSDGGQGCSKDVRHWRK